MRLLSQKEVRDASKIEEEQLRARLNALRKSIDEHTMELNRIKTEINLLKKELNS